MTGKGWRLNRVIFQLSLSPHQQEGICWCSLLSASRRRTSCVSAHRVKRGTVPRAWVIAIRASPTPALAQKPEPKPTTGKQFGLTDVAPLLRIPESFGLGATCKSQLVQPHGCGQGRLQLNQGLAGIKPTPLDNSGCCCGGISRALRVDGGTSVVALGPKPRHGLPPWAPTAAPRSWWKEKCPAESSGLVSEHDYPRHAGLALPTSRCWFLGCCSQDGWVKNCPTWQRPVSKPDNIFCFTSSFSELGTEQKVQRVALPHFHVEQSQENKRLSHS